MGLVRLLLVQRRGLNLFQWVSHDSSHHNATVAYDTTYHHTTGIAVMIIIDHHTDPKMKRLIMLPVMVLILASFPTLCKTYYFNLVISMSQVMLIIA